MFNFPWNQHYHHVPEAEDTTALIPDPSLLEFKLYTQRVQRALSPLLIVTLLVISSTIAAILGLCIGRRFPVNLQPADVKHMSTYCKCCRMIADIRLKLTVRITKHR